MWVDRICLHHLRRVVRMNHFISAPRLRMQMIRSFGRHITARTVTVINRLLAAEYRARRPARRPRLTLVLRRRCSEWDQRHRVWNLRQWRHCIFSDESRFAIYQTDGRARVRLRQGERLIDVCIRPNHGNRGPAVRVWGAIHHGRSSNLVILDGTMSAHRYIQILSDYMHGRKGSLDGTLCLLSQNFSLM